MRSIQRVVAATIISIVFGVIPLGSVYADGIIIPEPPVCDPGPCPFPIPISQLAIEYHRVDVEISDQVAVTRVDQVFRNDNDWTLEGTYIFPIPDGAVVTDFILWIDGEPVEGKILTREEARRTYEEIVRTMRDPALLEYIDQSAVQASIFPIPPGGSRRVELEYTQVLSVDNGLIHYQYPLNTEKFSTEPLEDVVVRVAVDSADPIRAIYSPSHPVDVERSGEYRFTAGYEDSDVIPDKDFELFYSISDDEIGVNLISYRDPQGADDRGFFLLLASPRVETQGSESIPKDVIFVLDRSGSMDGEKLFQAQGALHYVLDHLNPHDRFNVIAFSTGLTMFSDRLETIEEVDDAKRWVDSLSAAGSTDINRALQESLSLVHGERPTILIFLTDGLPTEGVTDSGQIIENAHQSAPRNVRLFAFGVGYDVDTFLLDSLAMENRGTTTYVTPAQAIDEAVSGFYTKVSLPVLTDIELDFGDIVVSDVYPEPLPDLFAGSQLIVVGRYLEPGRDTVRLSGLVNNQETLFRYPDQHFRSSGGEDFLPRLWATRKIGYLLNQIRLHGPDEELIDQIVKLSIRYGIVTPYTSYLVTEPMALGAEAQEGIAADAFNEMLAMPTMVSGEKAVGRAADESEYREAEIPLALDRETADLVRVLGSKTFRQVEGVWMDTAFDPDTMEPLRVPFLSQDYFALSSAVPEIGDAFALGQNVIIVSGGEAYQVVDMEADGDEIELPVMEASQPEESPASGDEPATPDGGSEGRSFNLPCPGFSLLFGVTLFPLSLGLAMKRRN
jgi:Ca-activated chloride channel family protein